MKKLLSLLLTLCMILSLCVFASADGEKLLDGRIVILYTNDVHGYAVHTDENLGYSFISAAKKNLEAQGAFVLLVDAGDALQGMPIVNMSSGATAVEFMNKAGYDIACPGNHDFDFGVDNLLQLAEKAEYQYLCANILDHISGECKFTESTIVEAPDGFKIGFFGLDTPECATKVHPDKIRGLDFLSGEALVQCAQAQVDSLKNAGANYVVCLGHLGEDDESAGNRSIDLIPQVEGIDLFIDAHSHHENYEMNGDTLRVSAGWHSEALGYLVLTPQTLEDGTLAGEITDSGLYRASDDFGNLLAFGSYAPVDEELDAYVNSIDAEVQAELSTPFAETKVLLNGERAPGNRTEETNLGDFACDAMLWAANRYSPLEVVAAVTNGGGIRATIEAGEISMLDMKTVFPFGNTVAVLAVPGSDLLEVLEAATYSLPEAIGGFPQVAGIEYEIDTAAEWVPGEQYPDSTYFAPAQPGTRVTIKSVGGEPFDPDAIYNIVTNDFCAAGGDQYYAFRYSFATAGINTGLAIEDALVQYTQEVLGGVIGEEYAEPAGRITVIAEAAEAAAA